MVIMENPMKMDDLGYHYFWKHPYMFRTYQVGCFVLLFVASFDTPNTGNSASEGSGGFTSSTHPRGATKMKRKFEAIWSEAMGKVMIMWIKYSMSCFLLCLGFSKSRGLLTEKKRVWLINDSPSQIPKMYSTLPESQQLAPENGCFLLGRGLFSGAKWLLGKARG